jgi:hypothetical protein
MLMPFGSQDGARRRMRIRLINSTFEELSFKLQPESE